VSSGPFHVFYSYSHADRRMLDRLRAHLAMLRRHGLITEWFDRDIEAGAEWRAEITRQLEAADVILLLVSVDFLASTLPMKRRCSARSSEHITAKQQ
jgi:hypothetical protein